ncbi:hypothetical protein TRFO_25284 [Tritrichomonas foetus]|uniref:Uncharacterized protein n=1 Tax=Tritrichomonas foetus TaxID=1144522 RepID=A0A1J4KAC0_9EUKA|nr:hypothetical protein TRFO_25284 [Tritrichomonas foetus]|eukprot:OHT06614.1 hypothetical protein TRFO_25284 [Tritrichomonas foetus]
MLFEVLREAYKTNNVTEIIKFLAINGSNIHSFVPKQFHDPDIFDGVNKILKYTYLDLAAFYGSTKIFQELLKRIPKEIILESSEYHPLIYYALKSGNDETIYEVTESEYFTLKVGFIEALSLGKLFWTKKFFNNYKALNPNAKDEDLIFSICSDQEFRQESPLKLAIQSKNIHCVGFILNITTKEIPYLHYKTVFCNSVKQTPLHVAAKYGCSDIVTLLMNIYPAMVNMPKFSFVSGKKKTKPTPVFYALKHNPFPDFLPEMFNHSIPMTSINVADELNNTALNYAISNSDIESVKLLLQCNNLDVQYRATKEFKPPTHAAIRVCNLEILKLLMELPQTYPRRVDLYDNTIFHEAAYNNWGEGFKYLIENYNDLFEQLMRRTNKLGFNVFHVAAIYGSDQIFRVMYQRQTREFLECVTSQSVLNSGCVIHLLAANGHSEILEEFLSNIQTSINLDQIIMPKATSLHYAIKGGHEKCVKILRLHGAHFLDLPGFKSIVGPNYLYPFMLHLLTCDLDELREIEL